MKIELGIALYFKQELDWLNAGLEQILDKTKNEINTTLYLSKFTDELYDGCCKLSEKFGIDFEPRGDNSPIRYYDEVKHRAFDVKNHDCAMVLQPDVIFLNKHSFDSVMDEASQFFDSKYQVTVSTDHPDDSLPLAIQIFTKKMWNDIGCGDINYYPAAGSEIDEYRRCYIASGLDLEDREKYLGPLDGRSTIPWTHRIRHKDLLHAGYFRGGPVDQPPDSKIYRTRAIDYGIYVFGDTVHRESWVPYHIEKWGGGPLAEEYIYPFQNKSIKIEWQNQENPYPESKFLSLRGMCL